MFLILVPLILSVSSLSLYWHISNYASSRFEESTKDKNDAFGIHDYNMIRDKAKRFGFFYFLQSMSIWAILRLAFYLQNNIKTSNDFINNIIKSGILLIVLFLICGAIIRFVSCRILPQKSIFVFDFNDSYFIVALFEDICLFFIDCEFALFVLVIILGKFIWLDSGFKEILFLLKKTVQLLFTKKDTCDLTILFGKRMLSYLFLGKAGELIYTLVLRRLF